MIDWTGCGAFETIPWISDRTENIHILLSWMTQLILNMNDLTSWLLRLHNIRMHNICKYWLLKHRHRRALYRFWGLMVSFHIPWMPLVPRPYRLQRGNSLSFRWIRQLRHSLLERIFLPSWCLIVHEYWHGVRLVRSRLNWHDTAVALLLVPRFLVGILEDRSLHHAVNQLGCRWLLLLHSRSCQSLLKCIAIPLTGSTKTKILTL